MTWGKKHHASGRTFARELKVLVVLVVRPEMRIDEYDIDDYNYENDNYDYYYYDDDDDDDEVPMNYVQPNAQAGDSYAPIYEPLPYDVGDDLALRELEIVVHSQAQQRNKGYESRV